MSCVSGKDIVTDGLVFAYDVENTKKSWKGKPTTNLFTEEQQNPTTWSNRPTADKTITGEIYNGGVVYRLADTDGVDPDVYVDNFQSIRSETGVITGDTYTFSMDVKLVQRDNIGNTPANNLMWIWYAGSSEYVYFSDLELNNWTQVSVTAVVGSTYDFIIPRIDYDNCIIDIANLQFEKNDFATPFVDGTRSNTEAIVDLTGNNTITTNNLTYNSDGSFEFDGVDDSFWIPSIDMSEEQTIEIWLQPLENDGSRRNPYNQAYGGYGTWTHEPGGNISYYYGNAGSNTNPYTSRGSATVVQNEIACMCVTRDVNTITWYKNGELTNTASNIYGVLTETTGAITIGNGYAGRYLGNIFSVKIYNKALTSNEVKQNFNAKKNIYGL